LSSSGATAVNQSKQSKQTKTAREHGAVGVWFVAQMGRWPITHNSLLSIQASNSFNFSFSIQRLNKFAFLE